MSKNGPETIISRAEVNIHLELPQEVFAKIIAKRFDGIEHSSRYNPQDAQRFMKYLLSYQEGGKTDE